ncbi:hypothetical protein ACFQ2B_05840 [Streptomyces stramineus]
MRLERAALRDEASPRYFASLDTGTGAVLPERETARATRTARPPP